VITQLHDSTEIRALVQGVDEVRLARELGLEEGLQGIPNAVSRLRVAAYLSLSEVLGEGQVDNLLRQFSAEEDVADEEKSLMIFRKWSSYISALLEASEQLTVEDLLFFATAGLLGKRPVEIRTILRRKVIRNALDSAIEESRRMGPVEWEDRVTIDVSTAMLLLIRQEDHRDVASAGRIISRLADAQHEVESKWLSLQSNPRRNAIVLLGLYHLAQAVTRTSEFLLAGSVTNGNGQTVTDFAPELRRLLVRAEEYLHLSGDLETLFWLNAVAIILWRLRTDSIWVAGRGISRRLDELLDELAGTGRERPIFSLLPSQQEALRKSLLDPTKIAVVLQMPTNSGKTLLAEFSIIQAFEAYRDEARVVYVVPTRALATQVRRSLAEDLGPLGIPVSAAGSAFEEDPYELNLLLSTDGVVVATPEKLDLLLRAHPAWFDRLRLVVIDEAHLLDESERGVRLELLLANIRREHPQTRLLLLTPFLDNAEQIATWLGGTRGLPIEVRWRPSRLLLGIAKISGAGSNRALEIKWAEPYSTDSSLHTFRIPTQVRCSDVNTTTKKVVYLAERFMELGSVLALYSASPTEAEKAAEAISSDLTPKNERPAGLKVAIALAKNEYGEGSSLAQCLERGVAFHHSSVSPMLRYLIEDQMRAETIKFIAATTTLAQGMNFPVAVVLVHSVHKPYGAGPLTPAEFWNIAGRAGRVGFVDKGLVIFASHEHEEHFTRYRTALTQSIQSALLAVLHEIKPTASLESQYRIHEALRPFIQYLAHAAANESPTQAMAKLDELLQASLANAQIQDSEESKRLRYIARVYLEEIGHKQTGYLKAADKTGLGSFSFDHLFGRIGDDPLLRSGPGTILANREEGMYQLIEVLKWLPELDLAIGYGPGQMNVGAVAGVVQGWIEGKSIPELADIFPGDAKSEKIRNAARYIYSKVSQTISWGAHAYMRGWGLRISGRDIDLAPEEGMLGAYIQYGVHTPEAAVASLLGVPRQFAEPFASVYRDEYGKLSPQDTPQFKDFVEQADHGLWGKVVSRSSVRDLAPDDVRRVWRQMQGLD
jgi:helicase